MFYTNLQNAKPEVFKRLTGASPDVFALMIQVLGARLRDFGRPRHLCLEDRLLMVLMYWREYRTQAHIGTTYGVSEATVCRTVQQFEAILIQDKRFHLPGKKALRQSDTVFEIVLIDATECPCERPKKNSVGTTPARRNVTPKKPR
jgi:Helix-turn-helix of DDE superfamily endonuclease